MSLPHIAPNASTGTTPPQTRTEERAFSPKCGPTGRQLKSNIYADSDPNQPVLPKSSLPTVASLNSDVPATVAYVSVSGVCASACVCSCLTCLEEKKRKEQKNRKSDWLTCSWSSEQAERTSTQSIEECRRILPAFNRPRELRQVFRWVVEGVPLVQLNLVMKLQFSTKSPPMWSSAPVVVFPPATATKLLEQPSADQRRSL